MKCLMVNVYHWFTAVWEGIARLVVLTDMVSLPTLSRFRTCKMIKKTRQLSSPPFKQLSLCRTSRVYPFPQYAISYMTAVAVEFDCKNVVFPSPP